MIGALDQEEELPLPLALRVHESEGVVKYLLTVVFGVSWPW